eukprot:g2128.t1
MASSSRRPSLPPLTGVRVLELEGIGPGPLGACMLADFGADVVTVSRVDMKGRIRSQNDPVSRGKRSIALNLKSTEAVQVFVEMCRHVDVVIEPFRPGVMEKLGLGPDVLMKANPRLIYARMTGWGQTGDPDYVKMAGHDANYIALSGALDLFRRGEESPSPPANFAGDYAGGGTMLAMGVLLALLERVRSGKGQVVDAAMVDGANYVALPLFKWLQPHFPFLRVGEDGHLDTTKSALHQAPQWCGTYRCADGEWITVQAIEPHFYKELLQGMDLSDDEGLPHQMDISSWPWMKRRFECIFATRTRDEWAQRFKGTNACVAPVLTAKEAAVHPHNRARRSFLPTPGHPGLFEPAAAPKLLRTPAHDPRPSPKPGQDTIAVLREYSVSESAIASLLRNKGAAEATKRAGRARL